MKHIPIEFTFYSVEGVPLTNAAFNIFTVRGGYSDVNTGIIVPGTGNYATDEFGKLVVELLPSNQLYYVSVEETSENTELLYKFVVPATEAGTLRFQDLITDTLDPENLNDALVAEVLGAKADTLAARDQAIAAKDEVNISKDLAKASADAAEQFKLSASASEDAALESEIAAKQSETQAKASEVLTEGFKNSASTSEANALSYRNTANAHRLAAEASATLAGTQATTSQTNASLAQTAANEATTAATNAGLSEAAVESDRAAVATMKTSVEETNSSSMAIKDQVDGLLQQALAIGSGWAPSIRVISDGATREVLQIFDWIGGTGVKPATGYIGSTGVVATTAEAINVKGANGLNGSSFTVSAVGLSGERGGFDDEPAGFSFLATDTALLYIRIGPVGWSDGVPFGKGDKGEQGDRGATGEKGEKGDKGDLGLTGPANVLSVGTVTTAPAGGVAAASITGTSPSQILNLIIPQGAKGDRGEKGEKGADGIGSGDMLKAVYDPTNSGSVTHADAAPWTGIEGKPALLEQDVYDPNGSGKVLAAVSADQVPWTGVTTKPAVIAAGSTVLAARSAIGLENVDNTADTNKPVSTAQAAAIATKQDALVSGSNIKSVNGVSVVGSGDAQVQWRAEAIPTSADLNTYQREGAFFVASNVTAASLLNSPTTNAFNMEVYKGGGWIQEITEFMANNTRKTYQRAFYAGTWSVWTPIFTGINAPTKATVGLSNVDNTADNAKPVSTAQQTALNLKQDTLVSGNTIKTINGQTLLGSGNIDVAASVDEIRKPSNLSPANAATGIESKPVLSASPYFSLYGIPMVASQWQVSTVATFDTTVVNTGDVVGTATSYAIASGVLSVNSTYYWRVRYKDAEGSYSQWSSAFSFVTVSVFNDFIPTPNATPANFGDPFEGGFYSGMIWNEVCQSATSLVMEAGTKTITVPDMAANPLFYAGQEVELRLSGSYNIKMSGIVVSALGTALTLNLSSPTTGGTQAGWSVMAKYRVIVSPKSGGESLLLLKNANTALPSGCQTLTEGYKATESMRLADTSTTYPAAHWARSLSIAGRNDWYLPAADELELLYRNLKPVSASNNLTARPNAYAYNYSNRGAVGAVASSPGTNNNSYPVGSAYTSALPAQTGVAAFKEGGAENLINANSATSTPMGSVTAYIASEYYVQLMQNAPGRQISNQNGSVVHWRAIRRSII